MYFLIYSLLISIKTPVNSSDAKNFHLFYSVLSQNTNFLGKVKPVRIAL